MSKAERILEQMRNNPRDWRVEQIETVAKHFGFGRIEARRKSHQVLSCQAPRNSNRAGKTASKAHLH